MSSERDEGQGAPLPFCLLCNSGLKEDEEGRSTPETQDEEQNQGLVLVNTPSAASIIESHEDLLIISKEMADVHGEAQGSGEIDMDTVSGDTKPVAKLDYTNSPASRLGDMEWIQKYQGFLSKTLHLNVEDFMDDDEMNGFKRYGDGNTIEEEMLLFCTKCKTEVEKFYQASEQVRLSTKAFEDMRDNIATSIVRTFVDQKLQNEDKDTEEEVEMEDVKSTAADTLLDKWRYIYTGEADRDMKERNLINDIREETAARNDYQSKTEFPDGTGLSAMELAKMQRMMTACYFTPKMAIVRKKGKLFFRVGIPREDKDKVYNCLICDAAFNHQRSLNIHMRRHRPFRHHLHSCTTCTQVFADRKDLILHKRIHTLGSIDSRSKYKRVQEYYTCAICSCKFSSKAGRNSHIKKYHPNEKIYTCALCLEIFISEPGLKDHFDTSHRNQSSGASRAGVLNNGHGIQHPSELFTCIECSKQFLKIKSLIEHRRVHAVSNLTECYYCGMGFEGLEALQDHTNVTHMDPNPFNCDGCQESFETEETLIEHMKSKSQRSSTFICETCGRVYRSKESLQKHLQTHTLITAGTGAGAADQVEDEDPEEEEDDAIQDHMCDVCDLSFSDMTSLEAHQAQHLPKLPFKCTICGDEEGFKDAKDLRKHKLEAHPECPENLPHPCTICWNSFDTQEALETHNTQTHERFKCHICVKNFKLSEHLKRHLFIHTGEKPYKCTICEKSFNQESNLKEHMFRHQGIRPHRCPHCPEIAFLRRVQLKDHMLLEHGLEDVPTLPIGRAAQNARRDGTYPIPISVPIGTDSSSGSTAPETVAELKTEEGQRIQVISYGTPITLPQYQKPLIVNDVTVRDDGIHERFAPLIMKSLQNKSNQPIIVRRGLQIPDSKTTAPYAAAIQIKSGGITTDGDIIEAVDGNDSEDSSPQHQQQQYIIYNV